MASFREMPDAKIALLFCISSIANIAVFLVPLRRMQAERSVDARNWAKLRAQIPKPLQEYGTALRIRNSTKNTELCARLLKNALNIQMCITQIGYHKAFDTLSVFACSVVHNCLSLVAMNASRSRCCHKKLAELRVHGAKRLKEYGTFQEYGTARKIRNAGQIMANT